jgi:TRAP-type C4-dicarboxylate transport system substrate-binding protein
LNVFGRAELQRRVVLVVALLVTAGSTGAFAREFRLADTRNEDYPTVQALRFMGRQISERSGGRPEIKVFHSRQFGEEKETLEQTRAGAIDLDRTNVALTGNIVPAMFHSIEHMQKLMSLKAWETLSPDDREIFRDAALRSSPFMREKWRDLELRSRRQAETADVVIVTDIDRMPLEAAMTGIYARAQRDHASAKLIERIRRVE